MGPKMDSHQVFRLHGEEYFMDSYGTKVEPDLFVVDVPLDYVTNELALDFAYLNANRGVCSITREVDVFIEYYLRDDYGIHPEKIDTTKLYEYAGRVYGKPAQGFGAQNQKVRVQIKILENGSLNMFFDIEPDLECEVFLDNYSRILHKLSQCIAADVIESCELWPNLHAV